MKFVKRMACVLTVAAAVSGIGVARYASAQSLPGSTACMATCGTDLGDCASGAGQANAACVQGCKTLRGSAAAECAQACAAGMNANIDACKATFAGCATSCSAS